MNKKIFSALCFALMMLVSITVQAQQRLIVTAVTSGTEYIDKGRKSPLGKGVILTLETKVYIPYNGSLTVYDEATSKEYTIKSLGWAALEEKLKESTNTVLKNSKDYLKSVLTEMNKTSKVKSHYVTDPATVTREKYEAPAPPKNPLEERYIAWKKKALERYEAWRKARLDRYANFVRQAWQKFKPEEPVPVPEEEEIVPMLAPDADAQTASWFGDQLKKIFKKKNKNKDQADKGNADAPKLADNPKPVEKKQNVQLTYEKVLPPPPVEEQPEPEEKVLDNPWESNDYMVFDVFGTRCRVRIGDNCKFKLPSVSESDVADAIGNFSKTQFGNMLFDCLQERQNHAFSDWAYYQMLFALTSHFYGEDTNEATLALAFLYSQSGYKMRLAHDGVKLYMLAACNYMLYNKSFFYIDDSSYFLLDGNIEGTLNICKATFPKESTLSLQISALQDFAENPTEERTITSERYSDFSFTIKSNKNYIDFYDTYPPSCVNNNFMTRWSMYANTPLEKGIKEQLYPQIREKLAGMSKLDAVQHLLNWVQTGFEYEYDEKVWGRDRAFFGEESLFYPFCDCEDRSILLSHLIRDIVELDVILIYYPGHLAMATNFQNDVDGDYIMLDDKKYVVCDPTYIGARVGKTMPGMDNKSATVIELQKQL